MLSGVDVDLGTQLAPQYCVSVRRQYGNTSSIILNVAITSLVPDDRWTRSVAELPLQERNDCDGIVYRESGKEYVISFSHADKIITSISDACAGLARGLGVDVSEMGWLLQKRKGPLGTIFTPMNRTKRFSRFAATQSQGWSEDSKRPPKHVVSQASTLS